MQNRPSKERSSANALDSAASCLKLEEFLSAIKTSALPYPPGLTNLGNTCYINATLQCLLTIQPLVEWLINQPVEVFNHSSSSKGTRLTPILSKLALAIFKQNYDAELEQFRTAIGNLVKDFKEPREQDAQEFLLFLLNRLHDESVQNTDEHGLPTSEILRIFEGLLQTQLHCLRCTMAAKKESKHRMFFFRSSHKEPKGNSEVFFSLSVPIPVSPSQIEAAVDSVDSNACDLNVVLNEIVDFVSCYRRLLKVHPSTIIQSVYNQILSFHPIGGGKSPKSTSHVPRSHHTSVIEGYQGSKEGDHEDLSNLSPSTSDYFLLVQAKSTGFGEWFLESSGRAVDLMDCLNVEDDFSHSSSVTDSVKRSLLTGDALFIVRFGSQQLKDQVQSTVSGFCGSSFSQEQSTIAEVEAGHQALVSSTSNAAERGVQVLLVHVEEGERNQSVNSSLDSINSARAACFRRFSLPFSVNVPIDIHFENLCFLAMQSLVEFCDNSLLVGAWQSVRFWVVDAAPGEPCEIDSRQEFPLLHSTIEVSSVSMPEWLSADNVDRPRLLRLLVVWPSQPVNLLPPFKVTVDASLQKFSMSSSVVTNSNTSHTVDGNSRLAQWKNSENESAPLDSGLTITKCLQEFIKTTNVSHTQPFECPNCKKAQTSALLITRLVKPPMYLLLHLNRFVHVPAACGGSRLMKINSLVDYPINGLDLSFMLEPSSDKSKPSLKSIIYGKKARKSTSNFKSDTDKLVYELVAVCNHKGSIETGHITAYCKSLVSDQWWHYNDLKVQKVSSDQVVQPGAYILFYKQRGANVGNITKIMQSLMQISKEASDEIPSKSSSSTLPPVGRRKPTPQSPRLLSMPRPVRVPPDDFANEEAHKIGVPQK